MARPDDAHKGRAVGIFDEHIILGPGVVGKVTVAGIFLDVQVRDGYQAEALRAQVRDHLLEMGKAFTIDGERSVALLKIDVKINDIGRNFLCSQGRGDFADAGFRVVAVTLRRRRKSNQAIPCRNQSCCGRCYQKTRPRQCL